MKNETDLFTQFRLVLCELTKTKWTVESNVHIALSGGLDSIVLLHLFIRLRHEHKNIHLLAHHVHHGLSKNADQWLAFCKKTCITSKVKFAYSKIIVKKTSGVNLEADAREKRYECLKSNLEKDLSQNRNAYLVTAHHQDDQLETVLLALKRGSGVAGLQGILGAQKMPTYSLLRPFLCFSRVQLKNYAHLFSLLWIEDESNEDQHFDRNFIRETITPLLKNRWPSIAKTVSRSANLMQEQYLLLAELAQQDLSYVLMIEKERSVINIKKLATQSFIRQKNTLRYWFKLHDLQYPSFKQLDVIFNELIYAAEQTMPSIKFLNFMLRRYGDNLYITDLNKVSTPKRPILWAGEASLLISGLTKKLQFEYSDKQGIIVDENSTIEICFRKHLPKNLTCTPNGRNRSRCIKKLLHEYSVPPWERDFVPFIFVDGILKQAVGSWYCDNVGDEKKVKKTRPFKRCHITLKA
ncbi:MAG: tRNA lysidine(34) synthetase TilS [Psychromonas sp.]|nr:tRNA lysidine(34) synthetase TilS [Psychromonas sp.]